MVLLLILPGFPNRAATDLLTSLFHMHHILSTPFPLEPPFLSSSWLICSSASLGTLRPHHLALTCLVSCIPNSSISSGSSLEELQEKLLDKKSMKGKMLKALNFSRFYSQWQKKIKLCKEAGWKANSDWSIGVKMWKRSVFLVLVCLDAILTVSFEQPALYKVIYAFT